MYMLILNFTYPLRCLRVPLGVRVPPVEYHWYRIWVSENRVLRRIFGPKREEVEGGWRRLHNEELHNCILLGWSSQGGWGGRCLQQMRNACRICFRKLMWRGHLEELGVDVRIKVDDILTEVGWEDVEWIHVARPNVIHISLLCAVWYL
jgi:hypothetical protein